MEKLLKHLLKQFPLSVKSIEIIKDFNIKKWHNEKHFKILVNNCAYSARFISTHRSNNEFFGELSDEIIEDQIKFTEFLVENRIPFMRIVKSRKNERFMSVLIENQSYRFILFKWIDGIHITKFDYMITEKVGMMAASFHKTAARFKCNSFPKNIDRLTSLLWLSGCINWGFYQITSNLINTNENKLKPHLDYYLNRGKELKALLI